MSDAASSAEEGAEVDEPKAVMTEEELSREWDLSTSTLRQWRASGQGPAYVKMGRLVRYLRADVEVWIDAHRQVSA
jgi:predicted DNA-binding transcriptional regulator AlpA